MKNKKGFFLAETIAVIAVVAVVLVSVFKIFSSVYLNYRQSEKYNTVGAINALANIQKYYNSVEIIDTSSVNEGTPYIELTNYSRYNSEFYTRLKQEYNVTNVYLVDLDNVESHLNEMPINLRRYIKTLINKEGIALIVVVNNDEFSYLKLKPLRGKICTFDGTLTQGAEFTDGQYTYRYMQAITFDGQWTNMTNDGWGVVLTDKTSTAPVTTKLCSYINNKPIVSMRNMFAKSEAISINLSTFDTSNVVEMINMFRESKTSVIDLSNFDTSSVTNMHSMFYDSSATEIIGLDKLDTSNVTVMQSMFGKTKVGSLDLSTFDTSKVTNMSYMFFESDVLNIKIDNFNTSNVTNMHQMFVSSKIETLDLSTFDTSNVTDMSEMFLNATTTIGYAKTQADADRLNASSNKPSTLTFVPKWNKTFTYYAGAQTFTAGKSGWYKIELWGAEGGSAKYSTQYNGGKGAFTSGYIYLTKNDNLYVYVGGQGNAVSGTTSATITANGNSYNGGGPAGFYASNSNGGGGGGATDIRTTSGTWNDETSLNSRIMVAAGGGGARSHSSAPKYSGTGGVGGALLGGNGQSANAYCYAYGNGGGPNTQGTSTTCASDGHAYSNSTLFGYGWYDYSNTAVYSSGNTTYMGGGGGYYGGGIGYHAPSGGGSSFISGYAGVDAITSASDRTHTHNTNHYSGKYFVKGSMTSGTNSGNGKAEITYIGSMPRTNTNLNNVRYVKDCATHSSVNSYKNWVEVQVIKDGINLAYGKNAYLESGNTLQNPTASTNGIVYPNNDGTTNSYINNAQGNECIVIDLGATYNVDEIAVWHNYVDSRTFYNNITYVSSDNNTWKAVINKTEVETVQGKRVTAWD